MAIIYQPLRRFTDTGERILDAALDLLGQGTATVEPETVGIDALLDADAITAVSAVATATKGSTTKVGALTVNAGTSSLLTETAAAPADATVDSVVMVDQPYSYIYLTGYVAMVPAAIGTVAPRIMLVAHNIGNANETIADTTVINWAVFDESPQTQPTTPNAMLTVISGKRWLDSQGNSLGLPVDVGNMNATAKPVISIPNAVITEIELNSADIRTLAAQYTGQRGVLTVAMTTSVPNGAEVSLGTVTIASLTGTLVRAGQVAANPLLTAKVTGVNTVTVYARNNSFSTLSVPGGTQVKVIAF